MGDTGKVYDENDPEVKSRLEFLERLNKDSVGKLSCWQDMYDVLKGHCAEYFLSPTKESADLTMLLFMSFVLSLEQLPEEGDIQVLAARMNEIMVMRDDLTGVKMFVGEDAQKMHAMSRLLGAAALAQLLGTIGGESGEDAATPTLVPPTDRKHLH